jgi:hypothetical protein
MTEKSSTINRRLRQQIAKPRSIIGHATVPVDLLIDAVEDLVRLQYIAGVVAESEPDLAAAYSLCNGTSLPMDMQPMRERVLRTLDALRKLPQVLSEDEA